MKKSSLARVAIICLVLMASIESAQSRCTDSATKVVATYPNLFEVSPFGCNKGRLVDDLVTGAGRFGIASSDVKIQYAEFQTDAPPTVQGLISNVQNGGSTKTLIAVSHMSEDGIGVAYYATIAARNAAVSALVAAGWTEGPSGEILAVPGPPGPAIFLRGSGISGRIAPYLSTSKMVLAIGCNSTGLQSSFGSFSDPGDYSGSTFLGVTATCPPDEACSIANDIIAGMGCFRFPYEGHELDDAMKFKNWTGWVSVVGNMKNSLSCYKSCWNWSAAYQFVGVDPTTGNAVWGVEGEDALSYYELRGYTSPGAAPEVLEAVPGFGTDGTGHLRIHATALPGGYAEYDIVEYDNDRFISISPRFKSSDPVAPEFLAYLPGNDYDLEAISLEPEKTALPVYGGKDLGTLQETMASSNPTPISWSQDDLTGDAIVFAFHPGAVARVFQHLEAHYPTADGSPAEIVWFYTFGVPTPGVITNAVNVVRTNNQAAGGYPVNPDLQIVGDGGWATWPDDEDWSPTSVLLRGYRPIYPQGAIGVIPTLDDAEIERYLIAAEEYIAGQSVSHDAVCFVSDGLNDTSAVWLREDVQDIAGAFPAGTNVAFLYESDYASGDYTGRRAASYAAINAGVGWVFTTGFHFDVDILTYFITSAWDPLQLTTEQRNVWVNFGCRATGTFMNFTHQCKRIMFNELDRGVGVGFFGPMMDSHGIHHRQAREVFLSEMVNAAGEGGQITLAQFGRRFQDALVAAIPEYDWYADCWTYMGSIAISPFANLPSADISARARHIDGNEVNMPSAFGLGCPQGDLDDIVVEVALDATDVLTALPADAFTLSQPVNASVAFFTDGAPIAADSITSLVPQTNQHRTTFTVVSFGGCGIDSALVSLYGFPLGNAMINVRTPDFDGDGVVGDLNDFAFFTIGYPVNPAVNDCRDFDNDGQVGTYDFTFYASHYQHTSPYLPQNAPSEVAQSNAGIALRFTEEYPTATTHRLYVDVDVENFADVTTSLFEIAPGSERLAFVEWREAPSSIGIVLFTPVVRDGDPRLFFGTAVAETFIGSTSNLGQLVFDVVGTEPFEVTEDDFVLTAGEVLLESAGQGPVVAQMGGAFARAFDPAVARVYHNRLEQNFPNPFNPTTTLAFSLKNAEYVRLTIYDVAGRRVRELVNDRRDRGAYKVTWDGQNDAGEIVASGVYFYKLVAGSFTDTKKMTILK